MEINELYNIELTKDNITYSLDMLRLKTYITFETFSKIEFFIEMYFKDKVKKFWLSDRPMCFHYNYNIEIEEGRSFYFGFHHNNEKLKNSDHKGINNCDLYNFTIEFNPNKLKKEKLLMYLLGVSGEWYIKSYDIAIDLRLSILDLIWDISGRGAEKIDNHGYDNKTIYLGKGDGRVKIYNKKKESDLCITGDLTRVEVTREIEDFDIRKLKILNYDGNFPVIYTNDYIYSLSDYGNKNRTLMAVLYAVQNGYPIRNLSRDFRENIKKLLEGGYKIKFDTQVVTQLLRKNILYYFLNNDKVHFI